MSKTVVQQLIEANEKIDALKLELKAAQGEATKARLSAVSAKPTPSTATGSALTAETAKEIYAKLPTADRKEFRRTNWKLLGISLEK